MSDTTAQPRWVVRAPWVVALAVSALLALALAAVAAIDVMNVLGWRERLFVQRGSEYPWMFHHLFSEGRPVEWLQWLLLIVAGVTLALSAGLLGTTDRAGWAAWRGLALLGLAVALLAVKDAGNPRHAAADLAGGLAGATAAIVAEMAVFGAVALLAVAGLVAAWPVLRAHPRVRNTMLAGYGVYALAAAMSATSDLWYTQTGRVVLRRVLGDRMLPAPDTWEPGLRSWLFMDSVVEESLELVAAGLLAVAALIMLRSVLVPRARGS